MESGGPGKAAGPSGIVAEMLKPLGEAGVAEVRHHLRRLHSNCLAGELYCQFVQGQRGRSEPGQLQ